MLGHSGDGSFVRRRLGLALPPDSRIAYCVLRDSGGPDGVNPYMSDYTVGADARFPVKRECSGPGWRCCGGVADRS